MRNLFKSALTAVLFFVLILITTGCPKVISVAYEPKQVQVVGVFHRNARTQPVYLEGKLQRVDYYPEVWNVRIRYEDKNYVMTGQEAYEALRDQIGEFAEVVFEVKTYDDGKARSRPVGVNRTD